MELPRNKKAYKAGFKDLAVWRNAQSLRKLVYDISARFPPIEFKRVCQMRDAARSIKQNIQEGYQRPGLGDYIRFLGISRGSLGELEGDIEDCHEDRLITQIEFQTLDRCCGTTEYLFDRLIAALRRKQLRSKNRS